MTSRAPSGRISASWLWVLRDGRPLEWLCLLGAVLFASDARPSYAGAASAPVAAPAQAVVVAVDAASGRVQLTRQLDRAPAMADGTTVDAVSEHAPAPDPVPRTEQEREVQPPRSARVSAPVERAPVVAAAQRPPAAAAEPPRAQGPAAPPTAPAAAVVHPPASAPSPAAPTPAVTSAVALSSREQRLFDTMNSHRAAASLAPLRSAGTLTDAARERSQDMTAGGYFAHVSPHGETWMTLLNAAGWSFSGGGENLAMVGGDEAQAVAVAIEKLMASPTHRANIMNPAFRFVGVGAVVSDSGVTIFATIFTDR